MNMRVISVAAFLAAVLPFGPACIAQSQNDLTSPSGTSEVAAAQDWLQQLKIRRDKADTEYAHAKALYDSGQITQAALQSSASELQLLSSQLASAERSYSVIERDARLSQPIDLQMRDATVAQVAQAITEASKLPVRVDKEVPADKRLTAVASGVPVSSVLSTIAKQLRLQIAPDGDRGVLLRNWPRMTVNGAEQEFVDSAAPWSDAWLSIRSAAGTKLGGFPFDAFQLPSALFGSKLPNKRSTSPTGKNGSLTERLESAGWPGLDAARSPLAMTSVGNQVVIAEPGLGPHGEAGVWLTVYNVRGAQLVRQSSLFHKSRAGK